MKKYFSAFLFISLSISVISLSAMNIIPQNSGTFTDQYRTQSNLYSSPYNEFGDTYNIGMDLKYDTDTQYLNLTIYGNFAITGIMTGNTTELRIQTVNRENFLVLTEFDSFDLSPVSESANQSQYGFHVEKSISLPVALVDKIFVHLSIDIDTDGGENLSFKLDIFDNIYVYQFNTMRLIYISSLIISIILIGVLLGQPKSSPFHIMIQGASLFSHGVIAQVVVSTGDDFGFDGLHLGEYLILPLVLLVIPFLIDMRLSQRFIKKIHSRADIGEDQDKEGDNERNNEDIDHPKPSVNSFIRNALLKHFSKRIAVGLVVILIASILISENLFTWMLGLYILTTLVYKPVDYIDF